MRTAGLLLLCCLGGALISACGSEGPSAVGVLSTGRADAGPIRNGGPDGSHGDSADGGTLDGGLDPAGFGFDHLGIDGGIVSESSMDGLAPARMTPSEVPEGWLCRPATGLDAVCDCGCGAPDGACDATACAEPGCSAPGCDLCFDADGTPGACGPPDTWTCRSRRFEDGVCDCGCGLPDPDCESDGCVFPGCDAPACERCVDGGGRPAPCGPAETLRCDQDAFGDGACDCGCGQPDPDCATGSCTGAGCFDPACEVCHGPGGEPQACEAPAPSWHCATAARSDGLCDCGCGLADPDCEDKGCAEPGCEADACQACHDAFGRPVPCPGAWSCPARTYADGVCDCGCGVADPDCDGQGCDAAACDADACERRFDAEGGQLPPAAYACDPATFGAGDGCHCGCGALDPDCTGGAGCTTPGCRDLTCDVCVDDGGQAVNCKWRCDDALLADGQCDCGCGTRDPDCAGRACDEASCFAPACETCHDESGAAMTCDRGMCPDGFDSNGACDCGCRTPDPECPGVGACAGPGCSARACGVCHAADGSAAPCEDWTCSFEQQGGGDGCNCGCGAMDPDCAPAQGCAEAGCAVPACTTCRDVTGAPMECDP